MKALDDLIAALDAAAPKPISSAQAHELVGLHKARKALQLLVHGGHGFSMRDIVGHGTLYFRRQQDMEAFLAAHPRPKQRPKRQAVQRMPTRLEWRHAA